MTAPSEAETDRAAAQAARPLFYEKPVLLRADQHAALRLVLKPDFRFAAKTNAVPITISEFAAAARVYPIVFAGAPVMPVAVLGFETGNLFVDDQGLWQDSRTYIPAYVRRYPFTFIAPQGQNLFVLGLDMACERLVSEADNDKLAQPLFVDGKPSTFTEDALRFCGALQSDHGATRAFSQALADQNLLVDCQARAALSGGRHHDLSGFRIVDAKRFGALADAVLVDWHKRGWLMRVHAHLASLACWQDLLDRLRVKELVATEAPAS